MAETKKKFSLDSGNLAQSYLSQYDLGDRPTYAGTYDSQMEELYGQISNRPKFSYNTADDPLYQGYKDQYVQQGKLAMRDTMGQAAALTGGYASTYGQQVGQQAYDAYLQKLGEVIPSLYNMAYQQYKDQGDQLLQQYSLLGDLRDTEYGRYQDELGHWESDRGYITALENEDWNRSWQQQQAAAEQARWQANYDLQRQQMAYQQQQDAVEQAWRQQQFAYQQEQDAYDRSWNEDSRSYNRQQDAYGNLYSMIQSSGYSPSDEELAAAGMSRAAADAIAAEYYRGVDMDERNMSMSEYRAYNSGGGTSYGGGGSGGGGGTYYGGGADMYSGYTTADIVAGNSDAIAAAAAGYQIANTSGSVASERQIVDAIDFATNRANAGNYAYKPNKYARNY